MHRPDPLPHLHALALALRAEAFPEAVPEAGFVALQRGLEAAFGCRLFTVMAHDPVRGWNRRVFTSNAALWPLGGGKPNAERPWARHVVDAGLPWTGSGAEAMRWAYPDHDLIMRQGLGCGLNLPVRFAGRTLGVLNLLHAEGWYSAADFEPGLVFAGLAVPLLQAVQA